MRESQSDVYLFLVWHVSGVLDRYMKVFIGCIVLFVAYTKLVWGEWMGEWVGGWVSDIGPAQAHIHGLVICPKLQACVRSISLIRLIQLKFSRNKSVWDRVPAL